MQEKGNSICGDAPPRSLAMAASLPSIVCVIASSIGRVVGGSGGIAMSNLVLQERSAKDMGSAARHVYPLRQLLSNVVDINSETPGMALLAACYMQLRVCRVQPTNATSWQPYNVGLSSARNTMQCQSHLQLYPMSWDGPSTSLILQI